MVFDPERVSYERLLELFWQVHDPTQVNRQGPDVGTQYRTVIFYGSGRAEGGRRGEQSGAGGGRASHRDPDRAGGGILDAEDYHQQYFEKNRRIRSGLFRV